MVEDHLTDEMKMSGVALIRKMDEFGLRPDAALYLYDGESEAWKLVIAEEQMEKSGPREGYRQTQKLLHQFAEEIKGLSLGDISLRAPGSRIVAALSHSLKTVPCISGVRLKDYGANGTLVKDVYIYRLP